MLQCIQEEQGWEQRRDAYVTLVTSPGYLPGALALGASIRKWEKISRQQQQQQPRRKRLKPLLVALVSTGDEMKGPATLLEGFGWQVRNISISIQFNIQLILVFSI